MSAGMATRLFSCVQAMSLVQSIWSLGMSAAKMDTNSSGLLIRQLIFRKNSNSYVLGNKEVASSRCREILSDALAALCYDSRLFALHSLRSFGATAAVNSLGGTVSVRLLKLHGRWKYGHAKDLYLQADISAAGISVSSSLGF